jgi:hypothetical protein
MKYFFLPCVGALIFVAPVLANAQDAKQLTASTSVKLSPPTGVRLGAWLTQNQAALAESMYWPGTMWLNTSEANKQSNEKKQLLDDLASFAEISSNAAPELDKLKSLLTAMPVTGRKPLLLQDPWLMQAHSHLEPVISEGDRLIITGRSDRVRVINGDSQSCDVAVQPSMWAIDYLRACSISADVDTAWMIQPDGQVTRLGVGAWNEHVQDSPAPGAWLWVPPAIASNDLNERVAKIMATQGLAQGLSSMAPILRKPVSAPKDLPIFANDWGMTGLLQTATARSPSAGHVGLTANRVWPYTHTTLAISPFDSLELGFRYTDIANRLYGPDIAGDQSYKDKSSEIKWRMLDETASRPALAVGLRDPGGTGLFAGEYLVASKRWQNLDVSLGLGWGYLGSRGNFGNPLGFLGQRFTTRQNSNVGSGGTAQLSPLFTGRTALFGGVQWQTPIPELVLKVELDGNNYKNEPSNNNVGGARSPLNWGLAWQNGPLSLSVGYERGKQWMLGFSLSTDLTKLTQSKRSEPAPWPVKRPAQAATLNLQPSVMASSASLPPSPAVAGAIEAQTGWLVRDLRQEENTWIVELDNVQGFSLPERIDRGMSVVHEMAPAHVRAVRFVLMQQGVPVSSRLIDRDTWADTRYAWRGQTPTHASVQAPADLTPVAETSNRKASASMGLGYQQHLGGPDGYLYSLNATAEGQLPLWKGAWAQGALKARLVDNYQNYHYTAQSDLPRVRTLVREYLTNQRVTLPNAQVNQLNQWGDSVYSLAYAGALESMFAGVGAEVMWRPAGSQLALGADVNRLAQRDFDQRFSLRDYRVNSGHITAYWDTRWQGVEAKLMVGQYLAGDKGATLEVSRRFSNGARMGAWVTKTNVSSAGFGEGSFDKGVFFSIPFDAFLTAWSTQTMNFTWQPLIRDGGARLNKAQTLWNLTNSRDEREWSTAPVRSIK